MEYQEIRPITVREILKAALGIEVEQCFLAKLIDFIRETGCGAATPISPAAIEKLSEQYKEWIPWLVMHDFLEKIPNKRTFTTGQRLFHKTLGEYLIAQVGWCQINLIELRDGNRWAERPITVKNPYKITEDEMKHFFSWDEFLDERPYEHD